MASAGIKFVQKARLFSSAKSFFCRTQKVQQSSFSSSSSSNFGAFTPASPTTPPFRLPIRQNPFFSSRIPVELSCATESLMPLHSATASSLLKSMLSSKVGQWGTLSEGFATPL